MKPTGTLFAAALACLLPIGAPAQAIADDAVGPGSDVYVVLEDTQAPQAAEPPSPSAQQLAVPATADPLRRAEAAALIAAAVSGIILVGSARREAHRGTC